VRQSAKGMRSGEVRAEWDGERASWSELTAVTFRIARVGCICGGRPYRRRIRGGKGIRSEGVRVGASGQGVRLLRWPGLGWGDNSYGASRNLRGKIG